MPYLIKDATRAASRAISVDATWSVPAEAMEGEGGAIKQKDADIPCMAHWSGYTDNMKRAGLGERRRFAHVTVGDEYDEGVKVWAIRGDQDRFGAEGERFPMGTLTIGSQSMTVLEVAQSPFGGVYYLAGE